MLGDVGVPGRIEDGDGLDAYIVNIDIIGEGVIRLPCSRKGSSSEGSLASCGPFYASSSHHENKYAPLLACGPFKGI
jgi:hypothetical protein